MSTWPMPPARTEDESDCETAPAKQILTNAPCLEPQVVDIALPALKPAIASATTARGRSYCQPF